MEKLCLGLIAGTRENCSPGTLAMNCGNAPTLVLTALMILSRVPVSPAPAADFTAAGAALTAKDRVYWAFQPIRRPPVPSLNEKSKIANPIDAFILAELA